MISKLVNAFVLCAAMTAGVVQGLTKTEKCMIAAGLLLTAYGMNQVCNNTVAGRIAADNPDNYYGCPEAVAKFAALDLVSGFIKQGCSLIPGFFDEKSCKEAVAWQYGLNWMGSLQDKLFITELGTAVTVASLSKCGLRNLFAKIPTLRKT